MAGTDRTATFSVPRFSHRLTAFAIRLSDNHNSDLLMGAIQGNNPRLEDSGG